MALLNQLEVLDISYNKFVEVPQAIQSLKALTTLNVRGNTLSALPPFIVSLPKLRALDVRDNKLTMIPAPVLRARNLHVASSGNPLTPTVNRMRVWIEVIARAIVAILGAVMLYAAFVLYEDEERKVQNRLEELWIRIDDYQRLALSKQAAYLHEIAVTTSARMDKLFGFPLFSLRVLAAVGCYVVTATTVAFVIFGVASSVCGHPEGCSSAIPVIAMFGAISVGIIPFFLAPRVARIIAMVCVAFYLVAGIGFVVMLLIARTDFSQSPSFGYDMAGVTLTPLIGMAGGTVLNTAFIAAFRRILIGIRRTTSALTASALLALLSSVGVMLVVLPAAAEFEAPRYTNDFFIFGTLLFLLASNMLPAAVALASAALAAALLAHRITWPVVNRPIYALSRYGLFRRRKLLAMAGLALIAVQFPIVARWIQALGKTVGIL